MANDFNPLSLIAAPISGAFNLAGGKAQAHAARDAATMQASAINHAADLEADAAKQQLAFQQQQAALVQQNYQGTRDFNRQVYQDQQARLSPYRALGQGAVGQIANAPAGIGRLPGVR